ASLVFTAFKVSGQGSSPRFSTRTCTTKSSPSATRTPPSARGVWRAMKASWPEFRPARTATPHCRWRDGSGRARTWSQCSPTPASVISLLTSFKARAADVQDKLDALRRTLRSMERVLVAFSGGVDSSFLLRVAAEELGAGALALTTRSPTAPEED